MTELIFVIGRSKSDVVDALKTKVLLDKLGVAVMGIIMKEGGDEDIPSEFVEDLLKLKIMSNSSINT